MQCNYEIIRWILYITKVNLELFAKERFFSKKPLQNINIISISIFSFEVLILKGNMYILLIWKWTQEILESKEDNKCRLTYSSQPKRKHRV